MCDKFPNEILIRILTKSQVVKINLLIFDGKFRTYELKKNLNIISTYYDSKDGKFSFEISSSSEISEIQASLNARTEVSLEYLDRIIYWRIPTSHYYNAEKRNDGSVFVKGFWYENQEIKRIKINAAIIFRMLEGDVEFWETFRRKNAHVTRMLKLDIISNSFLLLIYSIM
ncbi:hypothetical protein C1645_882151 [Glomus cerebriforme]|uniref:Uncharacterized protein n=1 Tax=Glomus cerebriforme TaxID=658196 RepID=A0A397S3A9_9GLOM|nr:hypothetical protein C1645_882151 [Glomus cerebriforme]